MIQQDDDFFVRGWCQFPHDDHLLNWVKHAKEPARATVAALKFSHWLRCGRTWFVGVNALPNNASGAVPAGVPLQGYAVDFIEEHLCSPRISWDAAQVSVCYPGYPLPMENESSNAYQYRLNKDAAHVDGLLPEGPDRRRHLREWHRFILGIPIVEFSRDAAPFVVWEGSHHIVRRVLGARLADSPPTCWGEEDITAAYNEARAEVFSNCVRREIWVPPGEAFLAHRLCLHGIAPWSPTATATADGRMICYFRPEYATAAEWLAEP